MRRKKEFKKIIGIFLMVLIVLGNVTTSFAATGTIVNGRIVIRDGGSQFNGGTWVCQIDDGKKPLLDACCCDPTNHLNPSNGTGVTLSALGNTDIRSRMAYVCYKHWNGANDNTKYSLSRACAIATGAIAFGGYGYDNRKQVEALYNEAKILSSVPVGFTAYIAYPVNGTQNQLAWRYNPVGYANLVKTSDDPDGIIGKFEEKYNLTGAEYGIYSSPALSGASRVGTLTTNEKGISNTLSLKEGTYYVFELKAPKGYAKDSTVHKLTVNRGKTSTLKVSDIPLKGEVTLKKSIVKDSHLVAECPENYSLEGAEYTIYEVNENKIIGKLTTDKYGETNVLTLPAGMRVYAKETKAPKGFRLNKTPTEPVDIITGKTAILHHEDVPHFYLTDFKIIKKSESESLVPLEGAEYTVKYYKELKVPETGMPISTEEDIKDLKPYRIWTIKTNSTGIAKLKDEFLIKEKSDKLFKDDKGSVVGLHGTYVIEESLAPKGYVRTDKVWIQQVSFDSDLQQINSHLEDITDIEKLQTVSITINKVDYETGKPVPQGYGTLSGAIYEVYHYDLTSGRKIVDGKITTDKNGKGTITNLKPGAYKIREIKAPNGYAINKEVIEVKAEIREANTANFEYSVDCDEIPHTTVISKYFLSGNERKPLEGALLQLLDENGTLIEEFTTSSEDYVIKGLSNGKYILHEVGAPAGFVKSEDIQFEINDDVVKSKVEMKDETTKVEITKVDKDTGKPLSGASLQIFDLNGKVMDEWISTDKPHRLERLPVGEYTLHEVKAPDGYHLVKDQKFTVKETAEVQNFNLSNVLIPAVPKTGDNSFFFIYMMIMILMSGILVALKREA